MATGFMVLKNKQTAKIREKKWKISIDEADSTDRKQERTWTEAKRARGEGLNITGKCRRWSSARRKGRQMGREKM